MSTPLKLMFLGKMQILQDNVPITGFISRKAEALLCYLAVTGQPHLRQSLIYLLWDELPEESAQRNLRVTLTNLRRLVGSHLTITRQMVAFNQESPYWLDVQQFNCFFKQQEPACAENISLFEQSIELYTGDFLAGFHVRHAPVWEEWMLTTRERLNQQAWYIYRQLATYHMSQGNYQKGVFFASRLLALDPFQEEAHRLLIWLLAAGGQRSAALFQYETCRRLLTEELGVAPAAETVRLYKQICDDQFVPLPQLDTVIINPTRSPEDKEARPLPYQLPSQTTPFIGRAKELAEIVHLLHTDSCRLVTLAGAGGVGKTRLAIQAGFELVAEQEETAFSHGIYFFPLTAVNSAEFVIPALADSLPGASLTQGDSKVQFLNYLREKKMLLILDSFEHLSEASSLVCNILEIAPGIKILVTSRQELKLPGEWTLEIHGLPFPKDDPAPGPAETYEALQLFLSSARRVDVHFALTAPELACAARICRLVEGLPLALELASTWVRALSCAEIASEIENNLDFLSSTSLRGVPERHQSLRAVFDHSWKLLTDEEQTVLQQLSVFHGDFTREAAQVVANASLVTLSNLVNKFMLRRYASGWYGMHTLLRQYVRACLNTAGQTHMEVGSRHAAYYLTLCQEWEVQLKGQGQKAALEAIRTRIEDIRAAWQWAAEIGHIAFIAYATEALSLFYEIRAWFQEGRKVFSMAAQKLEKAEHQTEQSQLVLGRLWARQGHFAYHLGAYEEARISLEKSLAISRRYKARADTAFALDQLATLNYLVGKYDDTRNMAQESLNLYRQTQDTFGLATCLNTLGAFHLTISQHTAAKAYLEESLAICHAGNDQRGAARSRLNLGNVAVTRKAYNEAKQYFQESLTTFHEIGDQYGVAVSLHSMGTVAEMLGEYQDARRYHEESLVIYREAGDPGAIMALEGLGNVACCLDEFAVAREHFREALRLARERDVQSLMLNVITAVAQLYGREGNPQKAVELAAFCSQHPASRKENKESAQSMLAELKTGLPEMLFHTAVAAAQTRELNTLIDEILGKHDNHPQ